MSRKNRFGREKRLPVIGAGPDDIPPGAADSSLVNNGIDLSPVEGLLRQVDLHMIPEKGGERKMLLIADYGDGKGEEAVYALRRLLRSNIAVINSEKCREGGAEMIARLFLSIPLAKALESIVPEENQVEKKMTDQQVMSYVQTHMGANIKPRSRGR